MNFCPGFLGRGGINYSYTIKANILVINMEYIKLSLYVILFKRIYRNSALQHFHVGKTERSHKIVAVTESFIKIYIYISVFILFILQVCTVIKELEKQGPLISV